MATRSRRKKLSDEIREKIVDLIDEGELVIGDKLPTEGELIDLFGVSRTAVREAIKALASIGILEIRHGVGTFVASPRPGLLRSFRDNNSIISKADLLEILEFRQIFEPETAALAAERASEKDLKEMERCVEALQKGVDDGIRPPEDLGFHLALARATKNSALVDVSSLTIRFYEQDIYLPDTLDVEGHREIFKAIKAKDAEMARQAMCDHLAEIKRRHQDKEAPKSED